MATLSRFDLPAELDIPDDVDLTKDLIDRAFAYLLGQIKTLQGFAPEYEEQIELLRQIGLDRLNEALLPVYQGLSALTQPGSFFMAGAEGSNSTSIGLASYHVDETQAANFAPTAYLIVRDEDDPGYRLFGSLQSYDRDTGALKILIDQVQGTPLSPTGSRWTISAAASPSVATSAHEVGAYTQAEIDFRIVDIQNAIYQKAGINSPTLTGTPRAPDITDTTTNSNQIATAAFVQRIASALAVALLGGAPNTLNTLGKLATALGSNPNFASEVYGALTALGTQKANLAGATFQTLNVKGQAVANEGSITLSPAGSASRTGYVGFFGGDGVRHGYVGYSDGTDIQLFAERGAFNFNINAKVQGNLLWHAGNFNPNLKANLASPTFTGTVTAPALSVDGRRVYGPQVLSQVGNNGVSITTTDTNFLAFNFIATGMTLLAIGKGSCASTNTTVADVQYTTRLIDTTNNGIVASDFCISTTSTTGAGTATGASTLAVTGLVVGRTYQLQLRIFTNVGAASLKSNSLSLQGVNL